MLSTALRTASFALLVALPFFVSTACQRQQEGERCSLSNGNQDCDGNLVCTNANLLRKGTDGVDRCCPSDLESTTTLACARRTASGDGDGDVGAGGDSSGGGEGGSSSGDLPDLGATCQYNSDCQSPLVCGPTGECQYECKTDRDCASGQVCNADQVCE